ncbi:MAG: NAD-dependent epimerase/dehydratase family protein, partial [Pseudomonadota bacterium]
HEEHAAVVAEAVGERAVVAVSGRPGILPVAEIDCAVGKKYTALSVHKAMMRAGQPSRFRATGQTGIMISGEGIPIDAVVSDFVSGAAELLSPDTPEDHWSVIEGQGSLFHPGYASVTLGLLHGSQPDAFVVCHNPMQTHLGEWPDYPVPTITECIEHTLMSGKLTNPNIRCVGVSINTSQMNKQDKLPYLAKVTAETGLPCVDPILQGAEPIIEGLLNG